MIAYAGYRRLAGGEHDDLQIRATARWPLDTLRPPRSLDLTKLTRPQVTPRWTRFSSARSRVECIVGIWEWERRVKQTVIIDLEMAADIRRAAASDRIDDTIDYKKSREAPARVRRRVAVPAGRDADRAHRAASSSPSSASRWVKVRLNKQGAIRGARDVGIEIERRAADYAGRAPPHG